MKAHVLFQFLKVENILDKHWTNNNGWAMVKCINNVVLVTTNVDIQKANFIFISCNEITNINNQSWIFICDLVIHVKLCQVDLCTIYMLWWKKKKAKTYPNLGDLLSNVLHIMWWNDPINSVPFFLFSMEKCTTSIRPKN